MMASSFLLAPLFLVLPVPLKALIVVAGGFLFFHSEKPKELKAGPQAIEAPAQAE